MAKVFIPQVPSYFDRARGEWVPKMDIATAVKGWGEAVELLPADFPSTLVQRARTVFAEAVRDATEEDWMVAVGDPSLIALLALMIGRRTSGRVNMLKWDRRQAQYIPVEIEA